MPKVSMRGGFSDRNGIKPENKEIQLKDFDKRTRVQLLNMLKMMYSKIYNVASCFGTSYYQEFAEYLIGTVYAEPFDFNGDYDEELLFNYIDKTICDGTYDEALTLIEALIVFWDSHLKKNFAYQYYNEYEKKYIRTSLFEIANQCFEREYIGYRFVENEISPISDDYEINAIKETLSCKYQSVQEHISKANKFLSDRKNPDYENSIKESITAVEAICKIITKLRGGEATLDKMLKKLEDNGVIIHGSLKEAFKKLYGYTSDANGIRHAGDIGGPGSTFEEAKFMLVACCAFINYLIALNAD